MDGNNIRHCGHPPAGSGCMGRDVDTVPQTLKSRFENSSNYANTLTNLTEKRLVFLRKALKEVSKTLAEAVSELWSERTAAIKLMEQTEQEQAERDQKQWRGAPFPSNQSTIESFWQSPTPNTTTTPSTTSHSQTSRNENKKFHRIRRGC